jgi:ribonuclease BN (tRNA processing enzyme)
LIATLAVGLSLSKPWATTACQTSDVRLQVLGSGGPELDDGRASSSYIIWQHEKATVLLDVGPGSSVNFGASGADFSDIKALLLPHLHVDHSANLPAFIKGSYFTSRNQDLSIWGPEGNTLMPSTREYVTRLLDAKGAFAYLSDYTEANSQAHNISLTPHKQRSVKINDNITLIASAVHHGPIAAVAWRVDFADCSITFSRDMSNQQR